MLATLAGVALVLAGCGGSEASRTYSVEEVQTAFEAEGYALVEKPPPAGSKAAKGGVTYLRPETPAPLLVAVGPDQLADEAWEVYVGVGGNVLGGEESLTIRRANVIAISEGGLTNRARAQVRAAMSGLPDRGHVVEVLDDRDR
jgi:hypothetical protein